MTYPLDIQIEEQGSRLCICSDLHLEVQHFVKFWCGCQAFWWPELDAAVAAKPCNEHHEEVIRWIVEGL